jgi:hypothetical protein
MKPKTSKEIMRTPLHKADEIENKQGNPENPLD